VPVWYRQHVRLVNTSVNAVLRKEAELQQNMYSHLHLLGLKVDVSTRESS